MVDYVTSVAGEHFTSAISAAKFSYLPSSIEENPSSIVGGKSYCWFLVDSICK
jgi:hypothetical protein